MSALTYLSSHYPLTNKIVVNLTNKKTNNTIKYTIGRTDYQGKHFLITDYVFGADYIDLIKTIIEKSNIGLKISGYLESYNYPCLCCFFGNILDARYSISKKLLEQQKKYKTLVFGVDLNPQYAFGTSHYDEVKQNCNWILTIIKSSIEKEALKQQEGLEDNYLAPILKNYIIDVDIDFTNDKVLSLEAKILYEKLLTLNKNLNEQVDNNRYEICLRNPTFFGLSELEEEILEINKYLEKDLTFLDKDEREQIIEQRYNPENHWKTKYYKLLKTEIFPQMNFQKVFTNMVEKIKNKECFLIEHHDKLDCIIDNVKIISLGCFEEKTNKTELEKVKTLFEGKYELYDVKEEYKFYTNVETEYTNLKIDNDFVRNVNINFLIKR